MDKIVLLTEAELGEIVFAACTRALNNHKPLIDAQELSLQSEYGDIKWASRIIGRTVSTIYRLTHQKLIPYSKKGGGLYFSKKELIDWIASGKQKTVQEAKEEVDIRLASTDARNYTARKRK